MLSKENKKWSHYYAEPNFRINDQLWKFCPSDHLLHIHIPKCAGTWLKQIVYNSSAGSHRFNHGHLPAGLQKAMLEDRGYKWEQFKPWAIIRNPWDRLWSAYKYTKWGGFEVNLRPVVETKGKFEIKGKKALQNSKIFKSYDEFLPIHDYHMKDLYILEGQATEKVEIGWLKNQTIGHDFKSYITNLYNLIPGKETTKEANLPWWKKIERNIYLDPQLNFLREMPEKGEIIVPNLFRSNEIKKFLKWAESNSKDKFMTQRSKQRASYNKSKNQIHYQNMYDDDMINMVGELYKDDIEYLNFTFEN